MDWKGVFSRFISAFFVVVIVLMVGASCSGASSGDTVSKLVTFAMVIGIIIALAIVFGIFYLARRLYYAIKGEDYLPLVRPRKKEYQHQDVDAGSDEKSISEVLRRYAGMDTVGKYARSARAALESSKRRYDGFFSVLDSKFQEGTMSWDKFAVAADSAYNAVLRNCASVANTVQLFDCDEYRRLARLYRASAAQANVTITDLDNQKWWLLQQHLRNLDAIITSNDQLLYELDKLTVELGKLKDLETTDAGDKILEEIRTLIDETKYYQQAMNR